MRRNLLLIGLFVASSAFPRGEIVPIQDRAQGQSLVAGHLLNDSLFTNPAGAAFTSVYSVEGTYRSKEDFVVSILDTKTSNTGGAAGYFRKPNLLTAEPDDLMNGVKLSAVWRLGARLGLGVAGKNLWGTSLEKAKDNFKDADVGLSMNWDRVQLGVTITNLFGGDTQFDEHEEYAFGARVNYEQLLFLSAAVHAEVKNEVFKTYQYGIGAEYVSPHHFALKGGYRLMTDDRGGFWSFGASVNAPKVAIHYAMDVPELDGSTEHSLAVAFLL